MSQHYNDALAEQLRKNVWEQLKTEAASMSKVEYAQVSADIIGIFDPTPASDAVGAVLSAAQGDALGVLLSLAGMIPYAGDALAKPAKIAKHAPETAKALEKMLRASDNLAMAGKEVLKKSGLTLQQVAEARNQALKKVQQAMLDAKQKMPGCVTCQGLDGTKRKLDMPTGKTNGKWQTPDGNQPTDGNGLFKFDQPKTLPDGRTVSGIEFHNGAPNFDEYVVGGKHELWEVTGDVDKDAKGLTKMMQEIDPNWEPPTKKDFVLHHFEDGKVGYVPRVLHDKAIGGVAHTGGNSMINTKEF